MLVREATRTDHARCAEIEYLDPSPEVVAFMPSIDGARRLTEAILARSDVLVAVDGATVVGFAQASAAPPGMLGHAGVALRSFGPLGVVRLVAGGWPRLRVELPRVDGVTLQELHVDPARRGRGIGGALLDEVIRRHGTRPISLTTRVDNRARRLYERHGFAVVAERCHPAYERRTGSPGRVLMVRPGTVAPS